MYTSFCLNISVFYYCYEDWKGCLCDQKNSFWYNEHFSNGYTEHKDSCLNHKLFTLFTDISTKETKEFSAGTFGERQDKLRNLSTK